MKKTTQTSTASLRNANREAQAKHNTIKQLFTDLPVGTKVKVISTCVDFCFFNKQTGIVIENTGKYLGIQVKFTKPLYNRETHNFNPCDLKILSTTAKVKEPSRLSFSSYDVMHLYELALEHFCVEKEGDCSTCTHLKKRIEKFLGPDIVKNVTKTIKKNGYCNKLKKHD